MAPRRRPRTAALALAAGLLLAGVVALGWLLIGEDDLTGVAADGPAGPPEQTATPGPTTTDSGGPAATNPQGDRPAASAGPATSGPPAPPAPACRQLLSEEEAAAALRAGVVRVQTHDGFLVRACTFWSAGDRYLLVQVQRGVAASPNHYELSRLPGDRPVAGIGRAARWTPDAGLLDVLEGDARFQVGLFAAGGAPEAASPPPRLEAVARAVAARL
jgi:hypothetical protein